MEMWKSFFGQVEISFRNRFFLCVATITVSCLYKLYAVKILDFRFKVGKIRRLALT